jgi:hypothetical protein
MQLPVANGVLDDGRREAELDELGMRDGAMLCLNQSPERLVST